MNQEAEILHATTVSVAGKGVMIIGPSGSGKSALALQLIALGALLVADDRTRVQRSGPDLITHVPASIAGMIEARGVGILTLPQAGPTPVRLVVDMGVEEKERLPQPHWHNLKGLRLPCLHKCNSVHFPSAILLYMSSQKH